MKDVQHLKTVSGDELVCEIVTGNDKELLIRNPFVVIPTDTSEYRLVPWFSFSKKKDFIIYKVNILARCDVDSLIKKSYNEYVEHYINNIENISPSKESSYDEIMDSLSKIKPTDKLH